MNREVRQLLRKAKEDWAEEQAKLVEDSFEANNARKVFKTIKNLTAKQTNRQINVNEDEQGNLLTGSNEIAQRWKECCSELYNYEADIDRSILGEDVESKCEGEEWEDKILRSEVEIAIKGLKKNKSPGEDNVRAELIQEGGETAVNIMHALCNKVLNSGVWPTQWTKAILIPLPKKANSKKFNEYRTVSLISHASKILLKITQIRITPRVEQILSEMQAGFRKDRSTTEQITNLRLICEKTRNHQRIVCHNFINFKKAFDRVWHSALWHTMRKHNIGDHITRIFKSLYEGAKTKVMTGEHFSDWFKSSVGVRQGCILSPTMFKEDNDGSNRRS